MEKNQTEVTCPAWMLDSTTRMRHLLLAISSEFLVNPRDILSNSRCGDHALCRQVGYWVLRQTTRLSHYQIADRFNRHNHTTIQFGVATVEHMRES
jgi:chromosomal replication initiation ATPase DnaA